MAFDLSLNKLPWYGQVGVFVALSLAGAGAFWQVKGSAMQQDIDARRTELAGIRADITRGLATARRLPQFRAEVTQLEAHLERLRAVLPEDQDVAELLRRVQGMATQSNLTIRNFSPKAVAKEQLHAVWPFDLQLEGTYHDIGMFLERVSKFPRIINVGNMHIKARDPQTASATVTVECTATTFVLIDPKPATPLPQASTAAAAPRTE